VAGSAARVLLVPGSTRARSTNAAVLRTAAAVAPAGVQTVLYEETAQLPAFNPDDDREPLPAPVARLRGAVHDADALLFCVPEYAGALPGAFKNVLDWTVGDAEPRSMDGKPVAWINASLRGAANAHASLAVVLGYVGATVVEAACRHLPVGADALGDDGLLAADEDRAAIREVLVALTASVGSA
jgi:chromate reductase, NAD(P)H dehydrogenase (quinone)